MAIYISPTDSKSISFPDKFSLSKGETATIDRTILVDTPIQVKVFGTYDTTKAPDGGGGDALHSFQSRKSDKFGGRMNDAINLALLEVYEKGINPYVKSLKVEFSPSKKSGPKVIWEAIITESPDGKAYMGIGSRGGAGNVSSGTAVDRAKQQADKKKKELPSELKEPNMYQVDVLDYRNDEAIIRQIFWQYTKPNAYPPKSGAGLTQNENTNEPSQSNSQTSPVTNPTNLTGITASITDTKIKLVKKSGPGELMGEIEKQSYFSEAVFDGLQFDTPGEYIITAVPESKEIDPIDFKITVKGDPIPSQEPKKEEPKVEGNRPIIAQIDKPSIKLKPIEIPVDNGQQTLEFAQGIGILPFIWYKAYQIQERDIKVLNLYHDGIVPCCTLTFSDTLGFMTKEGMPLDNDFFELFLNSGSPNVKSIHMRFKIVDFKENKNKSYTFVGFVDLKDFYKINFKSYTGKSIDVLRELSKEMGLGFNSNINDSTDSMKWINTGKKMREFINDIIDHSYISDDSFILGYIDFYYCFNFVDIEKEWKRDISSDVCVSSTGITRFDDGDQDSKIVSLILTKDKAQNSSNLYFRNEVVTNRSTKNSMQNGQFTISKFYDTASKSFLIFDVNSITSTDNKKLILKGMPQDGDELKSNYRTEFKGRVDLSNVHKNYLYATIQNKTNFDNLTRIQVNFEMPNANYNLYKYQKVQIIFTKDAATLADTDLNNTRLSGEWIILDIEYKWIKGKMTQNVVAVRKELQKTSDELITQVDERKPETKQGESNESVSVIPNSKFEVNETYTAQGADGTLYTIIVKSLLENGNEISTYVQSQNKSER
jgi:hypothetical protein